SPYSVNTAFSTSWLDDMFKDLTSNIDHLRATLITQSRLEQERDDLIELPTRMLELREGLETFLDLVFRESAYHESFFLRGVYCTALQENTPKALAGDTELSSGLFGKMLGEPKGRIAFARDLFAAKIFPEATLAQPVRRVLVSVNHYLNFGKAISVAGASAWLLGMFYAQDRLSQSLRTMTPALNQIDRSLQGVRQRGGISDDAELINYMNQQAAEILSSYANISFVSTSSIFLPASWFSSIDERLQEAIAIGYDRIVLPSLASGLIRKANTVVSPNILQTDTVTQQGGRGSTPTSLASYRALDGFIRQLAELEKHVKLYNELERTESIEDLGTLIKYVFNVDLPADFYKNSRYYSSALSQAAQRRVLLDDFKVLASQKLGKVYREFLANAFDVQKNYPTLFALQKQLEQLSDLSTARYLDDSDARALAENAIAAADLMSSGELSWLDALNFQPNATYTNLMRLMNSLSLVGPTLTTELQKQADGDFAKFKVALGEIKSTLTGPLFTAKNGQAVSSPSKALINVIDALSAFLQEPFMAKTAERQLVAKVPPQKLLFWDELALQKAVRVVQNFDDYLGQRYPHVSPKLQPCLKAIGRNAVRKHVLSFVAEAQTFHDEPPEFAGYGTKEMLSSQVHNIATVTPLFSRLFGVFDDGALVVQHSRLRELLVHETYAVLQKVDNLLAHDNLYATRDGSFDWWQGESNLALLAFTSQDVNDLKAYLKGQRFRVSYLSKEMAEPILTLLGLGFFEDVPFEVPLVHKWARIAAVLEDYSKQSPGNTLKNLEHFVLNEMNSITAENCYEKLNADMFDAGGDYFVEVRNDMVHELRQRCESLGVHLAMDRYNKAATFFNVNLAGRFPFTKDNAGLETPEAEPEDVVAFYQMFDQLTASDSLALAQVDGGTSGLGSITQFVRDMQSIRPLMMSSFESQGGVGTPSVQFQVDFRTDRQRERGGDKVLSWHMDVGPQRITDRDQERTSGWRAGHPVILTIRWAQNSDVLPLADPRLPNLAVEGPAAIFEFSGRWALLRLIKAHRLREDLGLGPAQPIPLEFTIPTALAVPCFDEEEAIRQEMARKTEQAHLFMRLVLKAPAKAKEKGATSAKEVAVLAVPRFPTEAPVAKLPRLKH
ncbi:MAG: type VI secretion protein IcmF/TssM N-terminal domain-containing protein, partial [Holosporales bacterium]